MHRAKGRKRERERKRRGRTARHVVIAASRKRNIGCGKNGSNESTANFLRRSDSPSKCLPLRIVSNRTMLLFGFVWTFRESIHVRIFDTDRLFIPLSREDSKKRKNDRVSRLTNERNEISQRILRELCANKEIRGNASSYSFLRARSAAAPPRSTDLSPTKTKRSEEKRKMEREEAGNGGGDGGAVATWSERARASWSARGKAAVGQSRSVHVLGGVGERSAGPRSHHE